MEHQEWRVIVDARVDAKRRLASVWPMLDGTDGAVSGAERCAANVDAIYAIEHLNAYNADVASPVEVRESGRSMASFRDSRLAPDPIQPTHGFARVDACVPSTSRWLGARVPGG